MVLRIQCGQGNGHECHEWNLAPLRIHRAEGDDVHFKYVKFQTSSRWCITYPWSRRFHKNTNSWKTPGGPITCYLFQGPLSFDKCGVQLQFEKQLQRPSRRSRVGAVASEVDKDPCTLYCNGCEVKFTLPLLSFQDGDRFNSCQVIYSQFGLTIHQNDHQARRRFVEWDQNEIAVVPDFHKRILFSDEAHFWLNGYVNKQNCRICSEANPQVYVETPLHPEKLTVWCALWAVGIIVPSFFKNDEGHNVTVKGDRYRAMITNFFIPELNNHDDRELWLQ
ncbi:uncharacterized protein TNCV_538671 [Trichonephila clavipes]|nr:uncharacterized protein TNCV_538671 [Trichonephila clavipes]